MADRVSEIRARADAAMPGPWKAKARETPEEREWGVYEVVGTAWPGTGRVCDMEFIAHARDDIPWLCDEVERLRALVRRFVRYGPWIRPVHDTFCRYCTASVGEEHDEVCLWEEAHCIVGRDT